MGVYNGLVFIFRQIAIVCMGLNFNIDYNRMVVDRANSEWLNVVESDEEISILSPFYK